MPKKTTKKRPASKKSSARKKTTRRKASVKKKQSTVASRKAARTNIQKHLRTIEEKIKKVKAQATKTLAKLKRDYDKVIGQLEKEKRVAQRELKKYLKQNISWKDIKTRVGTAARNIDKAVSKALAKIK